MERIFVLMESALMFLGVSLGAFGAHGLSDYLTRHDLSATFETAVRYQIYHALGLFVVAWAVGKWPGTLTTWAGYLLFVGVIIFSGSLYLLVMTNTRWLGAITPIGGVAFVMGWALLFFAAWRGQG
ncbi:MAG: DUF423 domain-containing protein [Chloroflexi bacterium]|nr:DUF423 domain-containing protein [Chloroflexota bacterium]